MKIGIVNATKPAMAPMLKIAPIASDPPKMSSRQMVPMKLLNHTAFTGVFVVLLTFFRTLENGKQSSRAYAKQTRDAAIYDSDIIRSVQVASLFWNELLGRAYHASLAHGESSNNRERQYRQTDRMWKTLY